MATSSTTVSPPRVVISGIGAVSPFGWTAGALWRGLAAGRTAVAEPRGFDLAGQRTRVAAEVPPPSGEPPIGDSIADRFAVAAAREAIAQAAIDPASVDVGVYFGSSTAGMREGEDYYAELIGCRQGRAPLRRLVSHQLNGPGDAVARALGASGPVLTVSSACSSGAQAIGEALRAVRAGEVEVAIAGGSDSLCRLTYAGFNALRSVDERPSRPFRGDRAGLSLGEGAAVVVVERADHAARRGATALALLLGAGASCDAHHMTAPEPEGRGALLAIRQALADASLEPDAIAFVQAHGTGTPLNDVAEWRAFHAAFGDRARRLPVTSAKGAVGHLLGTAGALEAVATVQCLIAGAVHPTAGEGEIDPQAPVDLVVDTPRELVTPCAALSTSLAFGGANAALVLGSPGEAA